MKTQSKRKPFPRMKRSPGVLCAMLLSAQCVALAATVNSWSTTGNLTAPRFWHSAVRLKSGKVLVSGGIKSNVTTASAEIYDPSSGSWTVTGSMNVPREFHTLTLLPNGKVLAAGGIDVDTSSELYDPASGSWTFTGNMSTGRSSHQATLLANGQVLVTGGDPCGGCLPLSTAEIYNPATGTWSLTGSMNQARRSTLPISFTAAASW